MRVLAVAAVALLLAGCAGRSERVMAVASPVASGPLSHPAPTPLNVGLSPAGTLWHLRAGLNVAALACRGPANVATVKGYNALLARHAAALRAAESAYAAEWQAGGGDWRGRYDDAMTRLYNFWGQARGRDNFCHAADDILAELEATPADAIGAAAPARLAALDRALAPPWLSVDPSVFGAPPVQVATR